MPHTTRTSVQAQTKSLERAWVVGSARQKPEYTEDFNVIETDKKKSVATFLPMQGLGTFKQKLEGEAPSYDEMREGIAYSATFYTMALAVKATEEGKLEDPENLVGMIPEQLAKSSRFSKDLQFYNLYNLAFNPQWNGTDGLPLCSTVHPLGPIATPTGVVSSIGATFSNSLGPTALSPESAEQARILFRTMQDDRGMPDIYTPLKVVVPEQMEKVAKEIFGTSRGAPFTSDNTKNVMENAVTVRTVRYLTSAQAWFMQGANGDPFSSQDCHKLFVAYKWDDLYKAWYDDETSNFSQKSSYRCTFGFGGWRGIVGSQGSAGNT